MYKAKLDGVGTCIVELITFEILAAKQLRLMGFDNQLIIDCFSNVVDSEVKNLNPLHYIQNHFQK